MSEEERRRFAKVRMPAHRAERIVARAGLRRLLAGALSISTAELRLGVDANGRPCLDPDWHSDPLDFNLSHSRGIGVVALSRAARIGVDVEAVESHREPMRLAEVYFTAAEGNLLRRLPASERRLQFCRMFTAKEAVTKALGLGLRLPLRRVRLDADAGAMRGATVIGGGRPTTWHLHCVPVPPGYVATVAASAAVPVRVSPPLRLAAPPPRRGSRQPGPSGIPRAGSQGA